MSAGLRTVEGRSVDSVARLVTILIQTSRDIVFYTDLPLQTFAPKAEILASVARERICLNFGDREPSAGSWMVRQQAHFGATRAELRAVCAAECEQQHRPGCFRSYSDKAVGASCRSFAARLDANARTLTLYRHGPLRVGDRWYRVKTSSILHVRNRSRIRSFSQARSRRL